MLIVICIYKILSLHKSNLCCTFFYFGPSKWMRNREKQMLSHRLFSRATPECRTADKSAGKRRIHSRCTKAACVRTYVPLKSRRRQLTPACRVTNRAVGATVDSWDWKRRNTCILLLLRSYPLPDSKHNIAIRITYAMIVLCL
jgi:hypothetical protein